MKALGIHLLIEFYSCNRRTIDDKGALENIMAHAAEVAGATVLKTAFQDFNPQGVSGVVVIAESHLTIHTWPEHEYAAVDIFTCGETVDPWKALNYLKEELQAHDLEVRRFNRGLPEGLTRPTEAVHGVQAAACGHSHG